MMIILEGRRAH